MTKNSTCTMNRENSGKHEGNKQEGRMKTTTLRANDKIRAALAARMPPTAARGFQTPGSTAAT